MREQLFSLLEEVNIKSLIINVYHYLGDMLGSTFPLVGQCHTKIKSQKQDHSERNTAPKHQAVSPQETMSSGVFLCLFF